MKQVIPLLILAMASFARAADTEAAPEELATSKSGGFRVMALTVVPGKPESGLRVWVESGKSRADLPPSPLATRGDAGGNSWSLTIPPSVAVSPDGQWIFATQKVCTGYCIGYLYKCRKGLKFAIATKARFDAMAWQFFGKTEGIDVGKLIVSDSPAHLIDFVAFTDRYLAVSLRGVIDNVPGSKKVASNPENAAGPTGVYDWQCLYDLGEGKFVLPGTMEAYNLAAWRRWADTTGNSWSKDVESEMNTALRALLAKRGPEEQKKLREEQAIWLKERDRRRNSMDFDLYAVTRARAAVLQMRAMGAE